MLPWQKKKGKGIKIKEEEKKKRRMFGALRTILMCIRMPSDDEEEEIKRYGNKNQMRNFPKEKKKITNNKSLGGSSCHNKKIDEIPLGIMAPVPSFIESDIEMFNITMNNELIRKNDKNQENQAILDIINLYAFPKGKIVLIRL